MIGVPRYWRSTTLPVGHVWANGDLALFADWPELKKIYDAGGFAGMLLAYNANSATIAANLGKWRPNAANPTGLYVPNLSEQFFRGWTQGLSREAGSWQCDAVQSGIVSIYCRVALDSLGSTSRLIDVSGDVATTTLNNNSYPASLDSSSQPGEQLFQSMQRTAAETRPVHVVIPVILYLGNSA